LHSNLLKCFGLYSKNIQGCSNRALCLFFPGEKKPNPAPIYGPSDDSVIFVGIVAGAIFLVAIAVGCFFGWRCRTNG